ncbi:uncharacterized protein TEOVI_000499200 [Trypanosoma equiperdum]|uniref:DUF7163 domain-containing protein n=2 Tax=Trypanozoon TaxID=39700 RepID=Q57VD4_TRYB2|nr:hypothetical protein, conserved [Trypanosoma brucei brucei TREU927]AAX70460.1 hypothetical protein, conserved [Trypanosoma brucei]AAZ11244.1 hypothetical protein, conserved [Trypanosoma brucei brucei TREU927]SCU68184.1 hypothetical protein, conserved [Trypanosoma equiperdum]
MSCDTVTVVFDLRYTDWELFDSSREVFITTVGNLFAIALSNLSQKQPYSLRLMATSGTSLLPVYDSACDRDNTKKTGIFNADKSTCGGSSNVFDVVRSLSELTPVRSPSRDTDRHVVGILQRQHKNYSSDKLQHHSLIFFTTFTTIGDFSNLVHSTVPAALPFLNDRWVSIHLDATAFTTTSLALTPATRSIRCPIAPACIRTALQQALATALSPVLPLVQVSLRYGRYTVPCIANRTYFTIPGRCCAAKDLEDTNDVEERNTLVFCGGRVCSSEYEREYHTTQELVLTASGIVNADVVDDAHLYGEAWVLRGCESLGGYTRSPGEWLHHLATELRGDALLLRTQQPLLNPPHQLAFPSSLFVGFFMRSDEMYLRAVIPPELRVERVESIALKASNSGGGGRLDPTLAAELRKATEALRDCRGEVELRQPVGVCRVLTQLRLNPSLQLRLEALQTEGAVRRTLIRPLHSHRR